MVPKVLDRRLMRNTGLLLIVLTLTTIMAGRPSLAANASKSVPLDNTQGNFATGVFQRTALGPQDLADLVSFAYGQNEINDAPGMVQLAPAGVLKPWTEFNPPLPYALTNAGVTAMGNYIYVIGGIYAGEGGRSDQVYWAKADPTNGNLVGDWQATPMPATQLIIDSSPTFNEVISLAECRASTANLAARSDVGVASLDKDSTTGYIYVIGGVFKGADCSTEYSTAVIQRATVNKTTGALTWTTFSSSVSLPSPEFPDNGSSTASRLLGADSISTTVVPYRDGNTMRYFLYVVGGKSRFIEGEYAVPYIVLRGEPKDRALASVYYTEIDLDTGNFKHPVSGSTSSVWVRDSDIQLRNAPTQNQGLWGAGISGTTILDGTLMKSMIYLAGGQLNIAASPTFNNFVYRADLGTNGTLNWGGTDRTQTVGPDEVGMVGRRGMGLVASNGKLYFIAGNTTNPPSGIENSVPTAFYDENGDLIKVDDTNFIIGTDDKVLAVGDTDGRYNSGVAMIEGLLDGTNEIPGWIYVIGGQDNQGDVTGTIFRGQVGGDDALNDIRARDGWYYSPVFQTSYVFGEGQWIKYIQARLLKFHWASYFERGSNENADIQIYFRAKQTASGQCGTDTFTSSDAWQGPLDGYAGNALYSQHPVNLKVYNEYNLEANFTDAYLVGNCVQYRAKLIQGSGSRSTSPKLLSVYVTREIVGGVNLIVPENGFAVTTNDNQVASMAIKIQNLVNGQTSETITLNQALEAISGVGTGSFYVHLCIARNDLVEGDPVYPTLTLPNPNEVSFDPLVPANFRDLCPYYADIQTATAMEAEPLNLMSTDPFSGKSYWYANDGVNYPNVPDLIKSAFKEDGYYTIGLLLDTSNLIPEEDASQPALGESTDNQSTRFTPLIQFTVRNLNKVYLPVVVR
ncbi:hypothetical protein [Candidatus Oscillochloris fontis]|uniref:hypothetical protein n=1 Tax=Candidatus Oscillochloris fontis TaxID=2496868 RepID=UPI00101D648E|nr:hypothetical protein [Candidatus Oscillochloris fontis]